MKHFFEPGNCLIVDDNPYAWESDAHIQLIRITPFSPFALAPTYSEYTFTTIFYCNNFYSSKTTLISTTDFPVCETLPQMLTFLIFIHYTEILWELPLYDAKKFAQSAISSISLDGSFNPLSSSPSSHLSSSYLFSSLLTFISAQP